jgi:UDP-N-acetylglucosamine diphosphorylase/glucosamine-1-phosphate N-acetyltransferase
VSGIYFYDDAAARGFEPFALTRPISEMRAGALLLRERWEYALGIKSMGFLAGEHLTEFDERGAPSAAHRTIPAGAVLVNSRCAIGLARLTPADVIVVGSEVAAITLSRPVDVDAFADGKLKLSSLALTDGKQAEATGRWINNVWDFIGSLQTMLAEDIPPLAARNAARAGGTQGVFVEEGATVESHVFFDTSKGPVLVRKGATVQAFTRLVGPCVIGNDSVVGTDRISGCSIGDNCRIHGELSASIVLGHSNKSHDGFVGHSYLGRWVNLGAGTTTSNLKNTYGTVALWTPKGEKDTELQFLGTMFGDHVKTGIGTQLNTGTVIGAGANIYEHMPEKAVPPFAWGDGRPYDTWKLPKFLNVARIAMGRRAIELSDRQARQLSSAFKERWKVTKARKKK